VWGFVKSDEGSAVILADVIAWSLQGGEGIAASSWLSPPAMLPAPPEALDEHVAPAADEGILTFLGDVSPSRSVETQLLRYGPRYPWTELGPLLHSADLVAANLESALTTRGKPLNKSYLLRAHPLWGQTLLEAGIDLVTLANNHALDYRAPGLDETVSRLQILGVVSVGVGVSGETAHRPTHFSANGIRVGVLAYAAARWNGSVDVPATDRLAWADPAAVRVDVQAIRDQTDVVVVLLHAGTEYAKHPSPDQVAFAHAAVDAGADLVVGHHPHVTQTVERYKKGLIVYSLGDALFDIPRQAAMRGELLRVHVTREGLIQAELWPFWIEDSIRPRLLDNGQGEPQFRIIYP
jgi:poly-gamma-glutamate synthesis protein (capsule biosynthesis protein)